MLPSSIDEVLKELHRITDHCSQRNNRVALFARVYYRVTAEIKKAALRGEFQDNERMLRFDVVFANLFIEAFWEHERKAACSLVWQEYFNWATKPLTVVQHVMMGMNAHINLDLGLASARFMHHQAIGDFEADFMKVNEILKSLVNEMQEGIARVSPLFFLVDWLGKNSDEALINFSMVKARQQAWQLALKLHSSEEASRAHHLQLADAGFALFGRSIASPPGRFLRWLLSLVARFETKSVGAIITRWS